MDAGERAALEEEVLAEWRAQAFERATTLVIEGYGPELLAFICSLVPDEDDASDIFATVCEGIWRSLPRFEARSSVRTWSYQLARHAIHHHRRSEQRRRRTPLDESQLSRLAQQVRSSTLSYLRSQIKTRIAELRGQLPLDDQTLLILRVDRELDWNEIAIVLQEGERPDAAVLKREAARLRKRFQLVKDRLRSMAVEAGIIKPPE